MLGVCLVSVTCIDSYTAAATKTPQRPNPNPNPNSSPNPEPNPNPTLHYQERERKKKAQEKFLDMSEGITAEVRALPVTLTLGSNSDPNLDSNPKP